MALIISLFTEMSCRKEIHWKPYIQKFNMDHPADYTGHSLSVSDVVILKKDGELTAHYVDSFGYQELPEFVQQRQKIQEIQAEQKTYPPLYLSDLSYASEHENADAYLDSRKLNLECKQAIEASIGSHFDGYHLDRTLRLMWWRHTEQREYRSFLPVLSSISDPTGGFQKEQKNGRMDLSFRRISAVAWISMRIIL